VSPLVAAGAQCVTLGPGDVLFVPRHWWHFVRSETDSVSVNLWLPHPLDGRERVKEALARLLVCSLHGLDDAEQQQQQQQQRRAAGGDGGGGGGGGDSGSKCHGADGPTVLPVLAQQASPSPSLSAEVAGAALGECRNATPPPAEGLLWLNPKEQVWPLQDTLASLNLAIASLRDAHSAAFAGPCPSQPLTISNVANALCSPWMLDQLADEIISAPNS
jgi:hypothetical protein